jgi:pseudaminic acid biosynthesis-associated methylase
VSKLQASGPKPLGAWSGTFGDDYTERCAATPETVRGRVQAWAPILDHMVGAPPKSALEVGPNLGLNLRALGQLSDMSLWGIEPNGAACERLRADGVLPPDQMIQGFGHEIPVADGQVDLAFTCGVLIHVDPTLLEKTVREVHRVSSRWVFCAEYFSPRPETITYRGEEGLLFKRDFGGLYLDLFDDLELVDYGFWWRRTTVMDDCTWWLFRKK